MKNWTHDHWMHLYWIIPQWKWQHSCGYDRMAYPKLGSDWKVSSIASTWGSVQFCGIAYFYYFLTLVLRQVINCLIQTQLNGLWIQTLKECHIKCNKTCKRNDQWTVFSTLQQCMKVESYNWEEAKGGYICLQNQPYYLKAIHNIYFKEENFVSSSDTLFFWHHGVKRKTTASPVQ